MTWSTVAGGSTEWTEDVDASDSFNDVSAVSTSFTDAGPGPGYVRGGYVVGGYIEPQPGTDWSEVEDSSNTWA